MVFECLFACLLVGLLDALFEVAFVWYVCLRVSVLVPFTVGVLLSLCLHSFA